MAELEKGEDFAREYTHK